MSLVTERGPGPVGRLIKVRRLAVGLTQQQLAVKLGVTVNTVARWEQTNREPRRVHRQTLAAYLGGDPSDYRED